MEQIYTIPVNEAFENGAAENADECPFCALYNKLEKDELEMILGASMMEPDTRIKTNESGFCEKHFELMFDAGKRLPLALILESHLEHISDSIKSGGLFPAKSGTDNIKNIEKLNRSCYLCDRIEYNFSRMIETAALLWQKDEAFREKTVAQHHYCLPHYGRFLAAAKERLQKKEFVEFYKSVSQIESEYLTSLKEDVSKFCKKFDYRYADEPWEGAKDAPERAKKLLCGSLHEHNK